MTGQPADRRPAVTGPGPRRTTSSIGRGLLDELVAAATVATGDAAKAALIHPPTLGRPPRRSGTRWRTAGSTHHLLEVPDAEDAKIAQVLRFCWDVFGQIGLDRTDVVIGLGGGSVTDLAGFAAATWMRGVAADPGADHPAGHGRRRGRREDRHQHRRRQEHGRRLLRADRGDRRSGHAGVVAAATSWSPGWPRSSSAGSSPTRRSWTSSRPNPTPRSTRQSPELAELVRRAVAVKAAVVAPTCGNPICARSSTTGTLSAHAIEKRERYKWRHGAAVSVGLVFAAELARAAGRLDDATADRHLEILHALGLPTTYDPDALGELVTIMGSDKKTRSGHPAFRGPGRAGQAGSAGRVRIRALLAAAYSVIAGTSRRQAVDL